jgi:hypothetical protein
MEGGIRIHQDRSAIVRELYIALEKLGAAPELLAIVDGWGNPATDFETLEELRRFNGAGPILPRSLERDG